MVCVDSRGQCEPLLGLGLNRAGTLIESWLFHRRNRFFIHLMCTNEAERGKSGQILNPACGQPLSLL